MNRKIVSTLLFLIAFSTFQLPSSSIFAQSNEDSGVSITQLQLETMSIFSSPSLLIRAERSRIRQDGFSYGFAAGGLLTGAENEQELSADRLDLMVYTGFVFGLHTFVNSTTVFYSKATISVSFLRYYWRRDRQAANANFAKLLQPELGFRFDLSENYQMSVGTSLLYGNFTSSFSLFEDRPDHFLGYPSLSISVSTIR